MHSRCSGNASTHCCWFGGKLCKYLEENTMPGRRWVCGLMREHQDWDKVLADPRYRLDVAPLWEKHAPGVSFNCKTLPAERCDCGGR